MPQIIAAENERITSPPRKNKREQRQKHRRRGHDRARQHGVDRHVDDLRRRQFLVFAHHLADAVEHDDRFVERIADDGENRGDGSLVELELREREEADSQQQIVHRADDRADRELPFEAEPQIGQHRQNRDDHAERAALHEFARDARADRLDAAEIVVLGERVAQLLDRRRLAGLAAGLHLHTQRHIGIGADALRLDRPEAERVGFAAQPCEIGLAGMGAQFYLRAAGEVDAEIHPDAEEQHHGEDRKHGRERIADAAEPHEADFGVLGREAQQFHLALMSNANAGQVRTPACGPLAPLAGRGLGRGAPALGRPRLISAAAAADCGDTTARSSCASSSPP